MHSYKRDEFSSLTVEQHAKYLWNLAPRFKICASTCIPCRCRQYRAAWSRRTGTVGDLSLLPVRAVEILGFLKSMPTSRPPARGWFLCRSLDSGFGTKPPWFGVFCCCSVAQSCPALCDPIGCSTPGFPVLHYLLEFAQTHVLWVSDAIHPSHPLLPPSHFSLNLSQYQGLFQWVSSLH